MPEKIFSSAKSRGNGPREGVYDFRSVDIPKEYIRSATLKSKAREISGTRVFTSKCLFFIELCYRRAKSMHVFPVGGNLFLICNVCKYPSISSKSVANNASFPTFLVVNSQVL
jgi:hypothetical protein